MLDPDTLCTTQVVGISNIQQPASNIFPFRQEREIKFMHDSKLYCATSGFVHLYSPRFLPRPLGTLPTSSGQALRRGGQFHPGRVLCSPGGAGQRPEEEIFENLFAQIQVLSSIEQQYR
jgi:hypothetical protein